MSLRKVARELAHRATRAGQRGRVASAAELQDLARAFSGRYPAWLAELLAEVPVCGLRLGWTDRPPRDEDDISWAVWSEPREARVLSLQTDWPGLLILPLGYVNVAWDGNHCGNPYFVRTDEGPDPALYQVYHDGGSTGEELVSSRRLVAPSLSAFFRAALVRVPPELEGDDEDAAPDGRR
jgi:hypothetical protein